jgi:hypothetical protein
MFKIIEGHIGIVLNIQRRAAYPPADDGFTGAAFIPEVAGFFMCICF